MSTLDQAPSTTKTKIAAYIAATSITGAIPVPATSAAIVAENSVMVMDISSDFGMKVTPMELIAALGTVGTMNQIARTVFIEAAKILNAGTGGFMTPIVCGLGSLTAGIQTLFIALLTVAYCRNGGEVSSKEISSLNLEAKQSYDAVLKKGNDANR